MNKEEKHKRIKAIIKEFEQKYKDKVLIRSGDELNEPELPRLNTGSLTLDYILGGGLCRGHLHQLKGIESSGKTSLALQAAKTVINQGGYVLWIKGERFSRFWARKNGLPIPLAKEDLKKLSREEKKKIEAEREKEKEIAQHFQIVESLTSESLLDSAIFFLRKNEHDLIIVDSIKSLRPSPSIDNPLDKTEMGAKSALLLDQWAGKVWAAFRMRYDPKTNEPSKEKNSVRNKTALLVINQMRQVGIGSPFKLPVDATGGFALKHLKSADVQFNIVQVLTEGSKSDFKSFGKTIGIRTTKCQIAPEGRYGEFDYYYDYYDKFKPGQIDTIKEVFTLGLRFGLIRRAGKYYWVGDDVSESKETLFRKLSNDEDFRNSLEKEIRKQFK